jgi:hypothetical protein
MQQEGGVDEVEWLLSDGCSKDAFKLSRTCLRSTSSGVCISRSSISRISAKVSSMVDKRGKKEVEKRVQAKRIYIARRSFWSGI